MGPEGNPRVLKRYAKAAVEDSRDGGYKTRGWDFAEKTGSRYSYNKTD